MGKWGDENKACNHLSRGKGGWGDAEGTREPIKQWTIWKGLQMYLICIDFQKGIKTLWVKQLNSLQLWCWVVGLFWLQFEVFWECLFVTYFFNLCQSFKLVIICVTPCISNNYLSFTLLCIINDDQLSLFFPMFHMVFNNSSLFMSISNLI